MSHYGIFLIAASVHYACAENFLKWDFKFTCYGINPPPSRNSYLWCLLKLSEWGSVQKFTRKFDVFYQGLPRYQNDSKRIIFCISFLWNLWMHCLYQDIHGLHIYFCLVRKVLKSITNTIFLKLYSTTHFNNLGNLRSCLKVSKKSRIHLCAYKNIWFNPFLWIAANDRSHCMIFKILKFSQDRAY